MDEDTLKEVRLYLEYARESLAVAAASKAKKRTPAKTRKKR